MLKWYAIVKFYFDGKITAMIMDAEEYDLLDEAHKAPYIETKSAHRYVESFYSEEQAFDYIKECFAERIKTIDKCFDAFIDQNKIIQRRREFKFI